MEAAPFGSITPKSSLAVRIVANYARLEGQWYRPDEVFVADKAGWPADWEGRLILALALHWQCTGRAPAYLDEIINRIPEYLNEKGYLGEVLGAGVNDEQQMAGHSWYLRGLLECRRLGMRKRVDPLIRSVVDNLLIPSQGNYARYPVDPRTRWQSPHWRLSQLQKKASTHAETSDCGCAFIMLDGATALYEETRKPVLRKLIYEMIARYRQLDFEGLHVQTHATLSACRGILRMHRIERDPKLLSLAIRVFSLYKRVAWTDTFGNYNWFGIPKWTEPCAIIDSFLVATQLWQATAEAKWLDDAHLIYHNAIAHAQRATGAFGTDTCVGPSGNSISPTTYEVTWCCTMRGAEGLARAAQYLFFAEGDTVHVPFYGDCEARLHLGSGDVALTEKTSFPACGAVSFLVTRSTCRRPILLRFHVPPGVRAPRAVRVNGRPTRASVAHGTLSVRLRPRAGDRVEFLLTPRLWSRASTMPVRAKGKRLFLHGPSVLGCRRETPLRGVSPERLTHLGGGRYGVGSNGTVLEPLGDVRRLTTEDSVTQVVF
jgi:hypothetical protein